MKLPARATRPQRRLTGARSLQWLAVLCLAVLSCKMPFDQPSSPEPYINRAQRELPGRGFTFFHVASFGLIRDQQYLQGRRDGPGSRDLAAQLAEVLGQGAEQDILVVLGGACSEKTLDVLTEALDLLGERTLGRLEMVFLGEARHGQVLATRLQTLGAHYEFVEIPLD